MKNCTWILYILTTLVAGSCSSKKQNRHSDTNLPPPNILWITCEDISPALGCYGDPYANTPVLDRLRALHDVVTISGGSRSFLQKMHRKTPRRLVLISVNASTQQKTDMDQSTEQPSILAAMNATTDAQIHRYNSATLELVESQLADWAEKLSSPDAPVTPYLIRVSFDQVGQPHLKAFLNKIPTSFNLTDEQVDTLIESARTLLREEPSFKKLQADLANQ